MEDTRDIAQIIADTADQLAIPLDERLSRLRALRNRADDLHISQDSIDSWLIGAAVGRMGSADFAGVMAQMAEWVESRAL